MPPSLKEQAVRAIHESYAVLSSEKDLSPRNERINQSLTCLVRTLTHCQAPQELSAFLAQTPELATERERLPELCGQAECEMEKFWARRLIASDAANLADFWYFREYQELCLAEMELFSPHSFNRISFLGAGALPLTAFLLAEYCPETKITCVDSDEEACALSRALIRKLGLENQIEVLHMNALDYRPGGDELVICASLLRGHDGIYDRLGEHGCDIIVRDAEGPYQYLYKPAKLPREEFREVSKTAPSPRRINTSRYYKHALVPVAA